MQANDSRSPVTPEQTRLIVAFLLLGVLLRSVRYLSRFPLTGDEARLAANFIGATYAQLTHPLLFLQIAPIPFLWIELLCTKFSGFNEYSLRLLPFLAGIASLPLFILVARRVLTGSTLVLAVGIFAIAYTPVRYSAEAKPYGIDLFVSLVLLWLVLEWWRAPSRVGWLWALTSATPVALAVSFPAVFVAGSIVVAFIAPAWKNRQARWTFLFFAVVVGGTFLALLRFVVGSQYAAASGEIVAHWRATFPPLSQPLRVPVWLFRTFTGEAMAYPVGGAAPWSAATLALVVVGSLVQWRRGQRPIVTLTLAMFTLGLLAAALHRYPFGRHARMTLYLAPCVCLALATGIGCVFARFRNAYRQEWAVRWTCYGLFFGFGATTLVMGLIAPYKGFGTQVHRGFARWFWNENPGVRTVCVDLDLHRQFYGSLPPGAYLAAAYPCYRAICAPRDRARSDAAALRCVFVHLENSQRNDEQFNAWLAEMNRDHELSGHTTYRLPLPSAEETARDSTEIAIYEAYVFTARSRQF